jgi:hypothetical protein
MTQYEQENDLGEGGGEVDEETMDEARRTADERRRTDSTDDLGTDDEPQPWAKASSGDADEM